MYFTLYQTAAIMSIEKTKRRQKMEVKIIAETSTNPKNFEDASDYNQFSGRVAGVCYMPGSYQDLENEPIEKTLKRANQTKGSGHHSVFDHEYVSLYLEDVPKLFAMLINNEKVYATSEKSARYTVMTHCSEIEKKLYDKWYNIFVDEISKRYGNAGSFMSENRIKKLAQENARYFLSVYTPTCMVYTTSYRQLNYLAGWMQDLENSPSQLLQDLAPYANKLIDELKKANLLDQDLMNDRKGRTFSLLAKRERSEEFGENYSINYKGSFASLAQAQRHRTLDYEMSLIEPTEFYVPEILRDDAILVAQWLNDMQTVYKLHPQAELVKINERGTVENLILKSKERLCSCAQLEIMRQTKMTMMKYYFSTKNKEVSDYISPYLKGARCTSGDYVCTSPCAFKDGINLEREI